jgi:hypothetical protein
MNSFIMRRWLPFFLLLSGLAGCRTERVAFDFKPIPSVVQATAVAPPLAAAESATSAAPVVNDSDAASPMSAQLTQISATTAPRAPNHAAKVSAKRPKQLLQQVMAARRLHQPPAAAKPADQGLGKIFFFLLAVVLAVLVGLAFGVAAIFSIGFWAALGYVVAGIVVLLLLRSLVRKLTGKAKK